MIHGRGGGGTPGTSIVSVALAFDPGGGAAALAAVRSGRYPVRRGQSVGVLLCGANTTAVSFE